MALTLSSELTEAMESQSRQPIVNLQSGSLKPSIPFDGKLLTDYKNETDPNVITHSSGRLSIVTVYGGTLRYTYTNTSRTEFFPVTFSDDGDEYIIADLCELTNGNIGLIFKYRDYNTYYIGYKILTVQGELVSEGNLSFTNLTNLFVERMPDDTYLLVYVNENSSIYKRTSSDFITWSVESTISHGLGTGEVDNPYIFVEMNGDVHLLFDYVEEYGDNGAELTNCYKMVSSDNGLTWTAPEKLTNYDTFSTTAEHPTLQQKSENESVFTFTEVKNVLSITKNTSGYCGNSAGNATGNYFNNNTRKLYFADRYVYVGTKNLRAALEIDVDSWEITNCWSYNTVPAFNEYLNENHTGDANHIGDGIYYCPAHSNGVFAVINTEMNSIRHYVLYDYVQHGLEINVEGYEPYKENEKLTEVTIDNDTGKMWLFFHKGYSLSNYWMHIGYIDLTQESGPYNFHSVFTRYFNEDYVEVLAYGSSFFIDESLDSIVITFGEGHPWMYRTDLKGLLINISSGGIEKELRKSEITKLPLNGFRVSGGMFGVCPSIYYDGSTLYAGIVYSFDATEEDRRGLMELDLSNNNITYHRPTYATVNNYNLKEFTYLESENSLIMISEGQNILKFDMISKTWEVFNSDEIPGFCPFNEKYNYIYTISVDQLNNNVFAGWYWSGVSSTAGIAMYSLDGNFRQVHYASGTKTTDWSFDTPSALTNGTYEYDMATAIDPDDLGLYGFWTSTTDEQIKWAKEEGSFDIRDYLAQSEPVVREESIDNTPGRVTFAVTHGHLFDPFNLNSLLNTKLKKGRKITLSFGEKIDDVDYWQAQGTYLVTELSMSHSRESYPIMQVVAEDKRVMWEHSTVRTTQNFSEVEPEYAVKEILKSYGGLTDDDFADFTFNNLDRVNISHQWLDTSLQEIVDQIYNRYGCFLKFDVNGLITSDSLSAEKGVSHTYSNRTKIVEFGPDDTYSDFTNRVTIEAQEKNDIEVVYPEEPITTLTGTVGWWGYKKDFTVYYSEDKSRRCQNPRLEVIESTTGIAFELAGDIDEELLDNDPYQLYCTVVIEAPSLITVLLAAIAAYIAGTAVGDIAPTWGGLTIPLGRLLEKGGLVSAIMVLGSVGNYQYRVHAQPIGKVQRLIQSTVDDLEHQQEINAIVEQRYFDPLCYEVVQCKDVAEYELSIAQMQRRRAQLKKVADLRDEQGDIIVIPHPYTQLDTTIFITKLSRSFDFNEDSGGFWDEIEGWVLT
jgi:hypothetical protein